MTPKEQPFDLPDYYINRELSWIAFNQRVLELAQRTELPLLERLKFLAIFSSNLDEFFMIRVAGLNQQIEAGVRKKAIAGRTPMQQLKEISEQVHRLTGLHTVMLKAVLQELRQHGLTILRPHELTASQKTYLKEYFLSSVMPVLTPLAVQQLTPCPLLPGLQMNVALTVQTEQDTEPRNRLLVIPVPDLFPRFLTLPSREGTFLIAIEDIIADNAAALAPGCAIRAVDFFRLTRDADIAVKEDEASDLLNVIEAAVVERRRQMAVRLEISGGASEGLHQWLAGEYELRHMQVYEIDGMLDAKACWQIVNRPGFDQLRFTDWPAQMPADLLDCNSLWEAIADRDILMYHPYESFEPVVKLLQQAAQDPAVLAIKQTLYRTSSDSPIIDALEQAAENGKEVTVLVELKARFEEERNVQWARRLEDAGCHVIYGMIGLKTHAKALLIIRQEQGHIRRYVHMATGNYNDKTAKLYSDLGYFSCNSQLASDVAAFFNLLTGFSENVECSKLSVAPLHMKRRFIELIDREIRASSPDRPGLIMAKINSLEDKEICQALYRASSQGVKILLNVRGICCLKPGMKGVSENIEVVSILGRYLEHARIFYFANGGHPEVYLSSADWMSRNLDKRLELLFPITNPVHKKRCKDILETCMADNTHAWRLLEDGTYQPVAASGKKVCAQETFYQQVLATHRNRSRHTRRFRPVQQKSK
jgi:polyphosphate kinase